MLFRVNELNAAQFKDEMQIDADMRPDLYLQWLTVRLTEKVREQSETNNRMLRELLDVQKTKTKQ